MEKFYSLINSPLDAILTLLCAALLSILGAFIKDWLLKLFSLFSSKVKKRRVANLRLTYRQAHLLLKDPIFLSLYSFRALKTSLLWVITNILSILLALFLQQESDELFMNRALNLTLVEIFESSTPDAFVFYIYMILLLLIFLLAILTGFKTSGRTRILHKAYKIRTRQLGINVEFP